MLTLEFVTAEHLAIAHRLPLERVAWHRGECSCGWQGPIRNDHASAEADVQRHVEGKP